MAEPLFVAGDWGTSSLRLHLCTPNGIVASKNGPGIAELDDSPGSTLLALTEPWITEYGKCPVFLAGMVGSNMGWKEAPYVACPADLDKFRSTYTHFQYEGLNIRIFGGLECTSPAGSPDFMRGEETQIFGAISLYPELHEKRQLIALPGTHTKWVLLEEGKVITFHTALTGELYDLLANHSVLVGQPQLHEACEQQAFEEGVQRSLQTRNVDLVHALFEVRARQISGLLKTHDAAAWLSGMIIGRDISGALELFGISATDPIPITLIGTTQLTSAYGQALSIAGYQATERNGGETVIAGLRSLLEDNENA